MTADEDGPAPTPSSERLRALLARAAEEQLHEQRQVSTVLAELRALVVALGERADDRLGAVEGRLDELAGRVDAATDLLAAPAPSPPPPPPPPTAEAVADALAERLVGRLAPQVVELVRSATPGADEVADRTVAQVAAALTALVRQEVVPSVREALADGERRLTAHVDEAVLALARILLRGTRRRTRSAAPVDGPAAPPAGEDSVALPTDRGAAAD